jgi:hypothetical protein
MEINMFLVSSIKFIANISGIYENQLQLEWSIYSFFSLYYTLSFIVLFYFYLCFVKNNIVRHTATGRKVALCISNAIVSV